MHCSIAVTSCVQSSKSGLIDAQSHCTTAGRSWREAWKSCCFRISPTAQLLSLFVSDHQVLFTWCALALHLCCRKFCNFTSSLGCLMRRCTAPVLWPVMYSHPSLGCLMRSRTAPLLVPVDARPVTAVVPSLGSSLAFLCTTAATVNRITFVGKGFPTIPESFIIAWAASLTTSCMLKMSYVGCLNGLFAWAVKHKWASIDIVQSQRCWCTQ